VILTTPFFISSDLLDRAANSLGEINLKTTINQPNGRFFYDPWEIKDEYRDSIWDKMLSTIPVPIGEARIIILEPGTCYQIHADIDDRYHLNIKGEKCYMIDIDHNHLYEVETSGIWFEMDAGRLHSAANFGRYPRIQLVVRKLLKDNRLNMPVTVQITTDVLSEDDRRFVFDQTVSPWLNSANKKSLVSDFKFTKDVVQFQIEKASIEEFEKIIVKEFKLKYEY